MQGLQCNSWASQSTEVAPEASQCECWAPTQIIWGPGCQLLPVTPLHGSGNVLFLLLFYFPGLFNFAFCHTPVAAILWLAFSALWKIKMCSVVQNDLWPEGYMIMSLRLNKVCWECDSTYSRISHIDNSGQSRIIQCMDIWPISFGYMVISLHGKQT